MNDEPTRMEPRQSIWRKLLFIVPLVAGVGVVALAVKSRKPPAQDPPTEQAAHVRIIEVASIPVAPQVTGYGSVRPARVWNAITQVSGKIAYVDTDLKKGALIKAGTVIARIDQADFKMAIAEATANIEAAEARLKELTTNQSNLRKVLEVERQSLALKKSQLERKKALRQRGSATPLSVEQEERDTLAQERRVIDIQNQLTVLPAQQEVQRAQIAVNKSRLESAELNLSRTEIRAPFAGRVAEAPIERTQFAQAGSRLAVIDSIDVAEIEAQFPIAPLAQFARANAAGMNGADNGNGPGNGVPQSRQDFAKLVRESGFYAMIRLLSGPASAQWRGQIVRISDTFDPQTRTMGIIAAVKDSYASSVPGERPPLTKGMFVQMTLHSNPLPPAIVIPTSAIHDGAVYVAGQDNRLVTRKVQTGLLIGNMVVVRSGLKAGERIVVSDLAYVLPGMLLQTSRDKLLEADIAGVAAGKGPEGSQGKGAVQ
ncbi:MAG: efflux RND transporter periplasmic adaptor subunit [Beijerinckiaceae bacterium]